MNTELAGRLNAYVNELFASEDEVLRYVRAQTAKHGLPQISLDAQEGKLLQLLVMLGGVERAVEIGTLAGYSGIWIARGLPEQGRLTTIEVSRVHADLAREHFRRAGLADKVTVVQGDGMQVLTKLAASAPYDLLFIDADKSSYPRYLAWAADNLRAGGLLLAHNAFWGGRVLNPGPDDDRAMVEFNRTLARHPAFHSVIVNLGDGMALAVKTS